MSSSIFPRAGNDATRVNGNTLNGIQVAEAITVRGSDFYFAICAIMGFTSLTVLGLSHLKPRSDRIFFYITAALNFTAFIAYFTMGSNLGWAPINVEFQRANPVVAGTNRAIYYVRYIDWVVTTPLLLMDLLLTAGLPWPSIIYVIFWDEVMIITGLVGALVSTRYKWGFYTIGCFAMFYVFYELAFTARKHANTLGKDVGRAYFTCGVLTLFIWTLYPIAWGVSEGGNVISSDSEAVFYGILDFIAKPCFSALLIWGHWNINPARMGVSMRGFSSTSHPDTHKSVEDVEHNRGHELTSTNVNTDHTAAPNYSSAPQTNDTSANTSANTSGHAAHRVGYTPAHEETTFEGQPHTTTHA